MLNLWLAVTTILFTVSPFARKFFFPWNVKLDLSFLTMISDKMVADGYDPLDPNGEMIIKWDLLHSSPGHHTVSFLLSCYFLWIVFAGFWVIYKIDDYLLKNSVRIFRLRERPRNYSNACFVSCKVGYKFTCKLIVVLSFKLVNLIIISVCFFSWRFVKSDNLVI